MVFNFIHLFWFLVAAASAYEHTNPSSSESKRFRQAEAKNENSTDTVQICRNKYKYSGEGTESLFWYQYQVVGALCLNLFVTFQKQLLLWMLTTPSPGAGVLTISLTQTHILPASPLSIPFRCTDIVASSRSWAVWF